jgi:hypothetical protein
MDSHVRTALHSVDSASHSELQNMKTKRATIIRFGFRKASNASRN